MGRLSAPCVDWLVEAVAPGSRPRTWLPGQVPPHGLVDAAAAHGVGEWVRRQAAATQVQVTGVTDLAHATAARYLRSLTDLGIVVPALETAGLPFLVVKGPALVATCYGNDPVRTYLDLDLVVRPMDVRRSVEVLRGVGVPLLDVNWPLLTREEVQELRHQGPTGGAVDLHWSLGSARPALDRSPPVGDLLRRSRRIDIGTVSVATLDPLDTLVHLAVHAAEAGGNRLVWLADLRNAYEALSPADRDHLVDRAAQWGAGPAVQLMLGRSARVLGLELPPDLLRAVGGRGLFRTATWLGDRVMPAERVVDAASLGRLLARSAARTQSASLRLAASKARRRAADGRGGPIRLDDGFFDPTHPESPFHPSGGEAGESAFLAGVEARAHRQAAEDPARGIAT